MKKIIIYSLLAALLCSSGLANAQKAALKKSILKVLYVGGSGDWSKEHFADTLAYQKSIQTRTASFEGMLKEYFSLVTVMQAKDYKQELSEKYDVTIMDGTPKPIQPRVMERDASGNVIKYLPAGYLTEDFNLPMLTIGELGEPLGRRIGLKTDWYCLCLDADAHHFRKEHSIFNGPFPVKMTIETKATPEAAYHYAYFSDTAIPDSIPVWKVQTKGYVTDKGFRVGMVARPWGFEDSPDAEYISSGVCAKTLDAVAIGRHGNFLHWGFAASPEYMTKEAQAVLANAIVYIAQFKGQGVIARKYNDRIATREYLKELKYMSTRESYEEILRSDEEFNNTVLERKKTALAKKEKGESLSKSEEEDLKFTPQPPRSFEDHLKRSQRDFFVLFGANGEAYAKFYDANQDYFFGEGFYHIEVDEDVKSLGIPNYDKRILDEAIKMWASGKDIEAGKRILARYTLCDFSTAKEWRSWYTTYKEKLFFTESGGWVFLINSREPGLNNYRAKEERKVMAQMQTGETDDMNPVSLTAGLVPKGNGNKEVVVKIKVHQGYHIYAHVAKTDPFIPTELRVQLPQGYSAVGDLKKPSFKQYNNNGTTVYEDELVFSLEIAGTGTGEVKCSIQYQCCDNHICMPPVEKEYSIKLP